MSRLGNQLVQQADIILDALTKEYQTSHQQLKHLHQFSKLLSKQFQIFSSQLTQCIEEYFKEIDKKQKEFWSSHLDKMKNGLVSVTSMLNRVSQDIQQSINIPIQLFIPQFVHAYEDLKTKATDLKYDIMNITTLPSLKASKSDGFLGYNGVIMNKKRSYKVDISQHQSQYSNLVKQLNTLHSNKHRTLKSSYQHLTHILNEIVLSDEQIQSQLNQVVDKNIQLNEENIDSNVDLDSNLDIDSLVQIKSQNSNNNRFVSKDIIQQIRDKCLESKLLKLIPQDSHSEHLLLPQLIESRIQNQVQGLLKSTLYSDPQIKSLILENMSNIKYFLDCLNCQVESQIMLSPSKYYQLSTMMKHILKLVLEQSNNEELVHIILLISLRVHCQQRLLIRQLSKDEPYWLKLQNWLNLLNYLTNQIDKQKQIKQVSPSKSTDSPSQNKNILSMSRSLIKFWSSKNDSKQEQNKSSLQILNQINSFLIQLQVPNEFAIKVILSLCQKQKISKVHFQRLIKQQKQLKRQSLNKKYSSSFNIKLRKQKKILNVSFDKITGAIKYVLQFLNITDYLNLMLVNHKFKEQLTPKIYKQLLQCQTTQTISKYRINIYKLILKSNKYSKEQYKEMVSQIPENVSSNYVIDQDAKRCLKWAPEHQPLLVQILKCYSFHNQDTKYVQGMHCLCQHLFHIESNNPQQIYSMFQTLINTHFKQVLKSANFQKLRLKMYQYSRIMEIQYPQLSEYFIKQKLQAEHYIIQWILTLWGDKRGELVNVLWDGFIVSGWRWWIKVCVWLVGLYQKQLRLLNFDSVLNHINHQIQVNALEYKSQELQKLANNPKNIREQIGKIKISKSFQKDLELQFDYSDYKLTPFLNTPMSNFN